MDWERALVTKIVDERNIRDVIRQKITSDFLYGTVSKAAYQWLQEWYRNPQYGDTPSWPMFDALFEGFEREDCEDSLIAVCEKVREQKVYSDIAEVLQQVSDTTMSDPMEGWEELKQQVSLLAIRHTVNNATRINDHLDGIRSEYFRMKGMKGDAKLRGLPYPWPAMNNSTMGACGGNLIVYYGRPKSKKTWLGLATLKEWNTVGAKCVCFSQELSDVELARRYVALVTGIDYRRFVRGELNPDEERDFLLNLEMFADCPPFDIDYLEGFGGDIGLEMKAKIDEHGYTAGMIDGAHKLGRDYKEIGDMTTACKRVAKPANIPILLTTHANRMGAKSRVGSDANDVAHSDAFFQDCDLAMRIVCDVEQRRAREAIMWTSAIREGEPCSFVVNMKLCEDMSQKRLIVLDEDEDEDPGELEVESVKDVAEEQRSLKERISSEMKEAVKRKEMNGKSLKLRLV